MITVFKQIFSLTSDVGTDDILKIKVPKGSEVLTVADQGVGNDRLCIWYRCDVGQPVEERMIYVVGTGQHAPAQTTARYISTVLMTYGLVLHFFEHHHPVDDRSDDDKDYDFDRLLGK